MFLLDTKKDLDHYLDDPSLSWSAKGILTAIMQHKRFLFGNDYMNYLAGIDIDKIEITEVHLAVNDLVKHGYLLSMARVKYITTVEELKIFEEIEDQDGGISIK